LISDLTAKSDEKGLCRETNCPIGSERGGSSLGEGSKVKRGKALISGGEAHSGPSPWGYKKPHSLADKAVGQLGWVAVEELDIRLQQGS